MSFFNDSVSAIPMNSRIVITKEIQICKKKMFRLQALESWELFELTNEEAFFLKDYNNFQSVPCKIMVILNELF
jgi:hypothetical protein